MSRILLVVDLQQEFKSVNLEMYSKMLGLARHSKDYIAVYATVLQNWKDSILEYYLDYRGMEEPVKCLEFMPQYTFYRACYGLQDYYKMLNINVGYDIIGFGTDSSIMKIALDMIELGYNVRVLSKFCYSLRGQKYQDIGLDLLRLNLGNAVI